MRVLAINCGSSTLKFQLLEVAASHAAIGEEPETASGVVERVGSNGGIKLAITGGSTRQEDTPVADHAAAMQLALDWLDSAGFLASGGIEAVAHRVVHGGHRFVQPTRIDAGVIDTIDELTTLAPLHNAPAVAAIRAAWERWGQQIPMVAVFDTAFHATLPEQAARYAIPQELTEKHHIRRYGFHGLAHRYMAERYAAITRSPLDRLRLITLQLGNGCSAAAIEHGQSIDTSMGLTPLEGLVMGTRSGDVDPALVSYLAEQEGMTAGEVETLLNKQSGLLGVSGRSGDMRDLIQAEAQGDQPAALAIDLFCYRVRKYIGAYLAALGGADAVIFGGGIGEHQSKIRSRICAGLEWMGLALDLTGNNTITGDEGRISVHDSRIQAYVIPVNEASVMARDAIACLGAG